MDINGNMAVTEPSRLSNGMMTQQSFSNSSSSPLSPYPHTTTNIVTTVPKTRGPLYSSCCESNRGSSFNGSGISNCEKSYCQGHKNKMILVAIGALIGFLLCMGYLLWVVAARIITQPKTSEVNYDEVTNNHNITILKPDFDPHHPTLPPSVSVDKTNLHNQPREFTHTRRRSLYIGVLTHEPYLNSRAMACNETWGQSDKIDKLEFYADVGDHRPHSTVGLVDIPESSSVDAWHTEKAFKMLEHMCTEHGNQYDWYIRAVDDSYINVDRLHSFLDRLDKTKELLLGHPTLPIDDSSYKALSGRGYCLGGPGLIFSRPLLQSLCPNLPDCRRRLSYLPADVALAKCTSESIGLECAFVPELHPYFVHSFEKNQFHLLDEFSRSTRAITFHPLKSPWMMRTLHEHIMKRNVHEAIVQLDKLQTTQQELETLLEQQPEIYDLPDIPSQVNMDSSVISRPERDLISNSYDYPAPSEVAASFMTRNGQGLTTVGCSPSYKLVDKEEEEVKSAVKFAKTSIQWGMFLTCNDVLSVYNTNIRDTNVMTVDMVCRDMRNSTQLRLARATMSKKLQEPYIKEYRTWKTSRHLIVVVEVESDMKNDPNLVDFLLRLYHLSQQIDQKLILSIIETDTSVESSNSRNDRQQRSDRKHSQNHNYNNLHDHSNEDDDYDNDRNNYLLKDLKQWYHNAGIELYVHHNNKNNNNNNHNSNKNKNSHGNGNNNKWSRSIVYSDVLFKLSRSYPDATVLVTTVTLQFDRNFLQRCGDLVKQGRQVYSPRPMKDKNRTQGQQSHLNKLINQGQELERPLCVHIKDFLPERPSKRKRRNRQREGVKVPLKVNTALDANLRSVL